jgi:hypothetical protein
MEVEKVLTCILLVVFSVFFSCATPQAKPPSPLIGYSIDVTIFNNTFFDLEIFDENRIIPRLSEKIITLPAFSGELNNGYPVVYRVPLIDDIFIKLNRNENIIIKNDQRIAYIEKADFHSSLCFLVLKNFGKHTISLKNGDNYLNSLVGVNPNIYSSSPYLSPGNTYLYELNPGKNELFIESDQYRYVAFPLSTAKEGYTYTFNFDGNIAEPVDERSLNEISYNTGFSKSISPIIIDNNEYFIGTWSATAEYRKSIDTYRISFFYGGRCAVKITNNKASQETTGNWSWDGNLFKLNATFLKAPISYQRKIEWASLVNFAGGNNSFNILAKSAASSNNIRFTFSRE